MKNGQDIDFKKIQSYTFIGLLIGITIVFFWMLRPYVYAIFWAAVLAVLFQPVYRWIFKGKDKRKSFAAGTTMIIVVLVFLIPLSGITSLIVHQAYSFYQEFGTKETFDKVSETIKNLLGLPIVRDYFGEITFSDIQTKLVEWSDEIANFIYQGISSGGQSTMRFLIQFFVMLYAFYYFVKDGRKILKKLIYLIPLGDKYEQMLLDRFSSTTKATLKGTLVIGLIQGLIGTFAFWITGVPAPAFWGLIMVILSIIPGVGAFVIMLPVALIMLFLGSYWQMVVILIFLVVASLIDNLLRGPLVGKDTQMHPLLIFFATLGGLLAFGITGIIIGPVIVAFLLSMYNIYQEKYKPYLDRPD